MRRIITDLIKHKHPLSAVLLEPDTRRVVFSNELAKLAEMLEPASDEDTRTNPEFDWDWQAYWVEGNFAPLDGPPIIGGILLQKNPGPLFLQETDIGGMKATQVNTRVNVFVKNPADGLLYDITEGASTRMVASLVTTGFSMLRAIKVLPAEFVEDHVQPIGPPTFKRGKPHPRVMLHTINLRAHKISATGEHSALDKQGRRFHFVRGHYWTPATKDQPQWRKSCWRGDPTLGHTTPIYTA